MPERISFDSFREQFPEGEIRVQLDWKTLEEEVRTGVAEIFADPVSAWNPVTLYAPWYRNEQRRPVSHEEEGAQPWRYDDLLGPPKMEVPDYPYPGELSAQHQAIFKDAKVLTLDVGRDRHLVLDGNHRLFLRLGFLATKQIVMQHYRIQAPLTPPLAPDVRHFT